MILLERDASSGGRDNARACWAGLIGNSRRTLTSQDNPDDGHRREDRDWNADEFGFHAPTAAVAVPAKLATILDHMLALDAAATDAVFCAAPPTGWHVSACNAEI